VHGNKENNFNLRIQIPTINMSIIDTPNTVATALSLSIGSNNTQDKKRSLPKNNNIKFSDEIDKQNQDSIESDKNHFFIGKKQKNIKSF
jgi:hypothetical protein